MVTKLWRGAMLPLAFLAGLLFCTGCDEGTKDPASSPPAVAGGPPGPGAPGQPAGGPGPGGGRSSPIRSIMRTLNGGRPTLTQRIGQELQPEQPDWGTIQKQASEYAQLAADLGKHSPPRGSQDSWTKFTLAYAQSASSLDKAAQAKDRDAALEAHGQLDGSCMACHREHRRMGPGMGMGPPPGGPGMRGGFPGGGPPPGGPPPQGGPPPGGRPPG
jgi:hypothetical protein